MIGRGEARLADERVREQRRVAVGAEAVDRVAVVRGGRLWIGGKLVIDTALKGLKKRVESR